MIYVNKPVDLPFKEQIMSSQMSRPKPLVVLGIGAVSLVALFFSLGDPGKEERQQMMNGLAESQENIHVLEERLIQQDNAYRQQAELVQQLTRKLETAEDQSAKLKAKVDELEKNLAKLKQPPPPIKPVVAVKPVVKPVAKPAPTPLKPAVPPPVPAKKP